MANLQTSSAVKRHYSGNAIYSKTVQTENGEYGKAGKTANPEGAEMAGGKEGGFAPIAGPPTFTGHRLGPISETWEAT